MFLFLKNIELTAADGAEMKNEQCGRCVPEDQKREDEEVFWASGQGQPESCKLHRCVSLRRNSVAVMSQKAVCGIQALFVWHLYF